MICDPLASPIAMHVPASDGIFFSVCPGKHYPAQNELTRRERHICGASLPMRQQ